MLKWLWILPGTEYERNFRASVFNSNSVPKDFPGMVLYHNMSKHCRWKQVHSTISLGVARYFFVMQISLSMFVFFLPVVTWDVLATVIFQLEMYLKREETVYQRLLNWNRTVAYVRDEKMVGWEDSVYSNYEALQKEAHYSKLSCGFPTHRQCPLCCKVFIFSKACDDRIATRLSC